MLRTIAFAGLGLEASTKSLNAMKRPLQVTITGCLFIVAGLVGLVYHLSERPLDHWIVPISMIRIIAVVSAFHSLSEFIPHVVLLMTVGYVLLGPPTSKYFQSAPSDYTGV